MTDGRARLLDRHSHGSGHGIRGVWEVDDPVGRGPGLNDSRASPGRTGEFRGSRTALRRERLRRSHTRMPLFRKVGLFGLFAVAVGLALAARYGLGVQRERQIRLLVPQLDSLLAAHLAYDDSSRW